MKIFDESLWQKPIMVGHKIKYLYKNKLQIGEIAAIHQNNQFDSNLVEYTIVNKRGNVCHIINTAAVAVWVPERICLRAGKEEVGFFSHYYKAQRFDVIGKAIERLIMQVSKKKRVEVKMTSEKARWEPLFLKYVPVKPNTSS